MRRSDGITDSMDLNSSKLWEIVKDRDLASCSPWGHRRFSNETVTATINDLKLEFMKFSGHNFNSF